jgi:hypothetical protein
MGRIVFAWLLDGRRMRTLLRAVIFGRLACCFFGAIGLFISRHSLFTTQYLQPTNQAFRFANAALILYTFCR